MIMVSQKPCADWHEWLRGKYIVDVVVDRIINFSYLIELKGESQRAVGPKQAKEGEESKSRWAFELKVPSGREELENKGMFLGILFKEHASDKMII